MKQQYILHLLFTIILSAILPLSFPPLNAQTCLPDGIRFTSQSQIENFSTNYPGCTTIEGDLIIGDPDSPYDDSDIQNLNGLSSLIAVNGDIIIASNDLLTSIQGLSNLTRVDSNLLIRLNPELTTLHGLHNVRVIEGSMDIEFNADLQLTGLTNLEIIRGHMEVISGSIGLLDGMVSIDSIYGDMRFQNTYFNNFTSISTLRYIGGTLTMSSTGIDNFTGLENLTELGGLYLYRNDNISLNGLGNVAIIHGSLDMIENDGVSMGSLASSLVEIGGNLRADMTNSGINGLTALKRIGGYVSFARNHLAGSITGPPNLKYIGGSLEITNNNAITAITGWNNLDTVIGYINIYNHRELTSVTAFQNLKVLTGEYRIRDNRYLEFLGDLPQLEVLGGIVIESNELLENFPGFPLAKNITGRISIKHNELLEVIQFPDIVKRISGGLDIFGNGVLRRISGFSNLTSVGGDFLLWINPVDTVDAFVKLDSIGGELNLDLNQAVGDFPHLNRFKYIGNNIALTELKEMSDLSCLEELDSIPGELRVSFCHKLTTLQGIQHLNTLGSLNLGVLKNLPNLNDLQNLTSLDGELSIVNVDSIANLNGLENITSINGRLNIGYNDNLTNIQGIRNIDPQSILSDYYFFEDIEIEENPLVSICDLPNICSALRDYKRTFHIEDNAPGCDDVRELDCKDYGFSGNVFYDGNQNKLRDPEEFGVPGARISLLPDNKITTTDQNGNFLVLADEGEIHTLKIEPWDGWIITTDSTQYTRLFTAGNPSNSNNNFGIYPEFQKNDLSVNLSSHATRCNETVTFQVRYSNTGTTKLKGRIKVIFNDDIAYSWATFSPFNSQFQNPNYVYHWRFDSLQPFGHVDLEIGLKMPNQNHAGEVYDFKIIALIDSAGTEVIKDEYVYSSTILCSFDPNDKIVSPPGVKDENFTLKDEKLTYTVRFQNTGNAHAIDIAIRDTIDANLDISTLQVVNSSYPVFTTIDGQSVDFFFQEIWLPDSLSNEPESHGFVTYEIAPVNDLVDFTEIKNEADIIFDFNEPILTNETLNTLVDEICDDVIVDQDIVICFGESYLGHTTTGIYDDTIRYGPTCDSLINTFLMVRGFSVFDRYFDGCQGDSFLLNGQTFYIEESIVFADSVYSPEGCLIQIVTAHVDAVISDTVLIDTTICEGQFFEGIGEPGIHYYNVFNSSTGCNDHVELHLDVIPFGIPPCITAVEDPGMLDLKVYPNPAHSEIFIETSKPIESVALYTVDGFKVNVISDQLVNDRTRVTIDESLADGFYILGVSVGGEEYFRKIVVLGIRE